MEAGENNWECCHVSFDIRHDARSTGREQLVRWTMGSVLCDAVGRHACPVSNTGQIPGLVERSAGAGIAPQTILEVVRDPPGSKSVPAHHAGDRLGGLVLVGIPGVGHAAEGRHVDWILEITKSSAFAVELAVGSLTSQVRSSIWDAAPRRSTEGDSTNFATCVLCRIVRLPRVLPLGL